ncbi:OmpA family protein [Shewanella sp. 10N.286.48.B5]|uniref:OmpA family protein n=1 Tax=Shewanella sp. 10N.286.48.B5 TaxID=1880834 RepID=UPI000CBEAF06|nr:OmpA family protein [Shewanella sp. 10N.286.48.B5]PMH85992.1 hypothetical protein BCU57_12425 [Shewanella sp. 10N.286.48.B5]
MYRQLVCLCSLVFSSSVLAWVDSDLDGVPDKKDACPNTQINTAVLANGCQQSLGLVSVSPIYFNFDQSRVLRSQLPSIERAHQLIKDNKLVSISLLGHTDNIGSEQLNASLSVKRAQSVKDILVEQFAIDADVIEVSGMGSLAPISTNRTALGRQKNRRVEFKFE